MSFTPVFGIVKISPTSLYIKDLTPVSDSGYGGADNPASLDSITSIVITALGYGEENPYNGTIESTDINVDFNSITGLKVNMDVPDGVVTFTVRYGVINNGTTTYTDATYTQLVTSKADLCIFAAIDTVSSCTQKTQSYDAVDKTLRKILLKDIAAYHYGKQNLAKADEAVRLICGRQPYSASTSNCNCE